MDSGQNRKIRRESLRARSLFLFQRGTVESLRAPSREPQVGHPRRHQEASQPACLQAQRGNSHAGERRRLTSHTAIARTRVDHNDGNLHPRGDPSLENGPRQHAPKGVGDSGQGAGLPNIINSGNSYQVRRKNYLSRDLS
jgi:hypothetical protein